MKRVRKNKGGSLDKWREFCNSTDLHGYKYLFMPGLSLVERICWAITLVTCIMLAIVFVYLAWQWYSKNPTVTVIESTHGPIWDIPFPSVVFCEMNLVSKTAARKFAKNIPLLPHGINRNDVFRYLKYVPALNTYFPLDDEMIENLHNLQNVLNMNNMTIMALLKKLSKPCSNLVERCSWKNTIYRCDLLFRPILTSEGYCCAFNYFAVAAPPEWLSSNELLRTKAPRRVASCGFQTGLDVLLNIDVDDYYSTMFASYGIRVFVDNAYHYPDRNSPVRFINPQTEVFIAISPETTYAAKGIAGFPRDRRNCKFSNEEALYSFTQYSYHNCLVIVRAVTISEECGCIPFHLPNEKNVRVCDFTDITCVVSLSGKFGEVTTNWDSTCLPDCEHYAYPLEVATSQLIRRYSLNGLAFFEDIDLKNHSLVSIFYNDLVSTKYRRDVYLNWQNLLASFGGLLSLLLGFTFIAGFDFILFLITRVFCESVFNKNKPVDMLVEDFGSLNPGQQGKRHVPETKHQRVRRINVKENKRRTKNILELPPPTYKDTLRY